MTDYQKATEQLVINLVDGITDAIKTAPEFDQMLITKDQYNGQSYYKISSYINVADKVLN